MPLPKDIENGSRINRTPDTTVNQHYFDQARELVSGQVSRERYEIYVTEERLEDVARWLEKGWGVNIYFQDAEWNWNGAGDDMTYAGLVIEPIFPKETPE